MKIQETMFVESVPEVLESLADDLKSELCRSVRYAAQAQNPEDAERYEEEAQELRFRITSLALAQNLISWALKLDSMASASCNTVGEPHVEVRADWDEIRARELAQREVRQ